MPRIWRPSPKLGFASLVALIVAAHAAMYYPYVADDALISLRYAKRLAEGRGLTWNDGERVEGFSNLLWTLGLAGAVKLGLNPIAAARGLGLALTASAGLAILSARPPRGWRLAQPGVITAGLFALSAPTAVWALGGMEQPLVTALLAWSLTLALPMAEGRALGASRATFLGCALGGLCLARADGAILAAAILGGLLCLGAFGRIRFWSALPILVIPVAAHVACLTFRLAYYGQWLPNTALAKVSLTPTRLVEGIGYLAAGIPVFLPFGAAAYASALRRAPGTREARRIALALFPFAVWSAYSVLLGPDNFPAHRRLAPLVAVAALATAEFLGSGPSRPVWSARAAWGWALVVALSIAPQHFTKDVLSVRRDPYVRQWVEYGRTMGGVLARAFGGRSPLVAVDCAGAVPFFTGFPSLDMLGLSDRYLAQHPPPGFGEGIYGHELGDPEYTLRRAPDVVLFGSTVGHPHAYYAAGKLLERDPRFQALYTPVRVFLSEPGPVFGVLWIRAANGRLGIARSADRIVIPAYLASANEASHARLDRSGRLALDVEPDQPARLAGLAIPAGRWRLGIEPEVDGVVVAVRLSGHGDMLAQGKAPLVFDAAGASARIDIECRSASPGALIHWITLKRGD